jgi:carbamoyltransferase
VSAPRWYVGLASSFHDPALAIVDPRGEVVFAEAAERALQDKRAFNAPPDALLRTPELIARYVEPGAELVAAVSWSEPVLRNLRLEAASHLRPLGGALRWAAGRVDQAQDSLVWPYPPQGALREAMLASLTLGGLNLGSHRALPPVREVRRYDHHLTHAAAGCHTSPFSEALVAVVDGYGERSSLAFFHWRGGEIVPLEGRRPRLAMEPSLGMFYAALCALCGFDPLKGEEWKVMGLAPYGRVDPALHAVLEPMVRAHGLRLTSGYTAAQRMHHLGRLRRDTRPPGSPPLAAADLARTGQEVFAGVMRVLLGNLHATGLSENLVLAGGCALNSSFNGRIVEETPFRAVHVPSAPADDGNALGAAALAHADDHPGRRRPPRAGSPYLGSEVPRRELEDLVEYGGLARLECGAGGVAARTAALLAEGKLVGWMQGRAEFGPRALGARSILADPRPAGMKDRINARVKFREEFRPFAPSILHEHGPGWFECYQDTPYMERALRFRPEMRERVPAVVHEDGTGRAQSVTRERAPRFHALISEFHRLTGVPVLLNTSFNVMGKPIIHTVRDAVAVFMTSGLDVLVVEDEVFVKGPCAPPAAGAA